MAKKKANAKEIKHLNISNVGIYANWRFMCANQAILSDFQIEIMFIISRANRRIGSFDIFS